jgi:hypothetical protein
MVAALDLPASHACVAAIDRCRAAQDRFHAIERLRQGSSQHFQKLESITGKKISLGQPPSLQRALEQVHAQPLAAEMFECHRLSKCRKLEKRNNY